MTELALEANVNLTKNAKVLVKNVYTYFLKEFEEQKFLHDHNKVNFRTSRAAGVALNSVLGVVKEKETQGEKSKALYITPVTGKIIRTSHFLSSLTVKAIRSKLYSYYMKSQCPPLLVFLEDLHKEGIIENMTSSSLKKNLLLNGFKYKTYYGIDVLLERKDVLINRSRFFKIMSGLDYSNIVWLGETSFDLPRTFSNESPKRPRLVVFHAGTANGFLKDASLLTITKPVVDWTKGITVEFFMKWFLKVIKKVPEGAVIIMNSMPHHNAEVNKAPNVFSDEATILKWLSANHISFKTDMLKSELLDLVRLAKPILPTYEIDRVMEHKNVKIIRTPPHHDYFNAIELMWLNLKEIVDKRMPETNLSDADFIDLVKNSLEDISKDDWSEVINLAQDYIRVAEQSEPQLETAVESIFKAIKRAKQNIIEPFEEDLESLDCFSDSSLDENDITSTDYQSNRNEISTENSYLIQPHSSKSTINEKTQDYFEIPSFDGLETTSSLNDFTFNS